MRISLLVTAGPGIGRAGHAGPGKPLYVGRGVVAHLRVPEDPSLLNVHFEIECSETVCRLRDMSGPAGTKVNGQLVRAAELKEGDVIAAGKSTFEVRSPSAMPPAPATGAVQTMIRPAPTTVHSGPRSVIDVLRREPDRLFVLLDAFRDSAIGTALANGGEKHQPLYENARGDQALFVAPHLVELTPTKPFTESLLTAGWGKSWGVFLTCKLPFDELLKHLRDCLTVRLVGGKPVYFRFYDPRVLRGFLPSCTADEGAAFFGPISAFLMEAEQPTGLLRLTPPTKSAAVAVTPPR
jgi:pSer/pThr/pTyr-binding forkhead associated (FHA) protein